MSTVTVQAGYFARVFEDTDHGLQMLVEVVGEVVRVSVRSTDGDHRSWSAPLQDVTGWAER